MISVRPNPDLADVVQEECVRKMAVLWMRTERSVRTGFPGLFSSRSPDREEMDELEGFVRDTGLSGRFDVIADRVLVPRRSAGGIDELVMETEFLIFRRKDVPHVMSLKVAIEVMRT